jgi:hypothetical protein
MGPQTGPMRGQRTVVVAAAVLATTVAIAPAAQAGPVFTIRFNGEVALASWTTCPEWELGDSCLDTTVFASDAQSFETSDQPTGGHHLRDRGDRLVVQRQWYTVRLVDGTLTGVPTLESFGSTDAVDVAITHRLTSASASASAVPMHTTDYVAGIDYDETISFTGDWEPGGELQVIDDRVRISDRFLFFIEGTDGWSRSSAPTATVDGAAVPGTAVLHELVAVRQFSLTVLKGANSQL